jgi:hypothetical protein
MQTKYNQILSQVKTGFLCYNVSLDGIKLFESLSKAKEVLSRAQWPLG